MERLARGPLSIDKNKETCSNADELIAKEHRDSEVTACFSEEHFVRRVTLWQKNSIIIICLLYTSDAADE